MTATPKSKTLPSKAEKRLRIGHPLTLSPQINAMQTVFNSAVAQPSNLHFISSQTEDLKQNQLKPLRYSEPVQFAVTKTVNGFTERRVKSEIPPNKKRRISKYPRKDDETVLTARKPVSTFVPVDAWAQIFRRSDLKFLLQARLVCRDFRDILTTQTIWRDARIYCYGDSIPDCPKGLNERQYVNLLSGKGCQVRPCTQNLTKKVYWAYMLRMCESCFKDTTQRQDSECEEAFLYSELFNRLAPEAQGTLPARLSELLPASNVLSIGGVYTQTRPLDRDNQMWRYADDIRHYCVKISDYDSLKQDFRREVMVDPSTAFLPWTKRKWNETRERVKSARELDLACRDLFGRHRSLREQKQDFFLEQASTLTPVMSEAMLDKMAAYHRALDTQNAASQRSWDTLVAKIDKPELRAQAKQLLEWDRVDREPSRWTIDEEDVDDRLELHRGRIFEFKPEPVDMQERSPEQKAVLSIAEKAMDRLFDKVHDEDLLLLLLQTVRHEYENTKPKPRGLNSDGTQGEYRLMLDDARMVVEDVLRPRVQAQGVVRSKRVLNSLRCIGCTRTDCHKTYNFINLFIHIRQLHSCYVETGFHYWKFAVPRKSRIRRYSDPVAWYQLPWPKSMPALPYHRKASLGTAWNPDIEEEYICHEPEEAVQFFEKLEVIRNHHNHYHSLASDLLEAVKVLLPTKLDPDCITRIAIEYATRRQVEPSQEGTKDLKLSIAQLESWESLLKTLTPKFGLRFKCGLCLKDPKSGNRGKQKRETLYSQPLQALVPHWHRKHRLEDDSLESELIVLTSDSALNKTITAEDSKLVAEHNRILKKQQAVVDDENGREKREKLVPREKALLEIPTIRSRLNLLFESKN